MKRRTLVWITVFLVLFFTIDRIAKSSRSNEFETTLIDLDTSLVEVIRLTFPADDHPILLVREPQGWIASQGNISTLANPKVPEKLLGELRNIQISRIVADNSNHWKDFGVGINQGPRVEVMGKDGKLEDFHIGKGSGDEEKENAHLFIRLFEQKEVYEVIGNDLSFASLNFDQYRNKHFIKFPDSRDLQKIIFKNLDTIFVISKADQNWYYENGMPVDSFTIEKYMSSVKSIEGDDFADNFDETRVGDLFFKGISFEIEGSGTVEVNCYWDSAWVNRYVLHSEQNPESWIESDSAGLYHLFFKQFEQLFAAGLN
ncbi:MAG: DUF4340 domain-containing protein [Bacteroidetes bacterium]|nr:MAG: DUF4340 domain-containing protein [Bacteroidota bacterium]